MERWEKLESATIRNNVETIGRGKTWQIINTSCIGFDIETTNDEATESAYMYIWQLAIDGRAYYGRTWDEFFCLLAILRQKLAGKIIIFIHNMGFEMSFLLPRLYRAGNLSRIFAREVREPLEVETNDGFIFRDTMALTNMSLQSLAKNYCRTQKLVGDLDYSIPRNSSTPLTATELAYCENDVLILSEYAEYLHNEFTKQGAKIPYTATGIVRRLVKQQFHGYEYKNACDKISQLYPQTVDKYNFTMKWLYRGAFCHAQTAICGEELTNVHSHDLKSAYPAEMAHRLYPMSPFKTIPTDRVNEHIERGFAVIMLVEFYNIQAKGAHVLESRHKVIEESGAEYDNGRLYYADKITVFITEIDLAIYNMMYKFSEMKILGAKAAAKGPLPDYLLKSLFTVYQQKEDIGKQLKADPDNSDLKAMYMSIKGKLNSFYGMCVARLNLEEVTYNGTWGKTRNTTYNEEIRKSVLSPYWGIYITAYTRLTICTAITALGKHAFYSDTDSIKHNATFEYFDSFNAHIEDVNKRMCDTYKLDFNVFKNLGKFDYEGTYKRFKTLGAKRYIVEEANKEGVLEVKCTVAGLPKNTFKAFAKQIGNDEAFKRFEPDLTFDISGKNAHKYNDETTAIIAGETMHEYGSCYIYSVGFCMRVGSGFLLIISKRKEITP